MAFDEDSLVSDFLRNFLPSIKARPLLSVDGTSTDGTFREEVARGFQMPVPASLREGIKQNASMFGQASTIQSLIFPGSKL